MLKKNKIKIFFGLNTRNGLRGGGFNFLNYLKFKLNKKNLITTSLTNSNLVLINSHHNFLNIFFYKFFFPKKIFIHRIDGPISKYVGKNDYRDQLVEFLNFYVADATIFQSNWSYKNRNFKPTNNYKIIHNCADKRFYKFKKVKKIKNSIFLSSWSKNFNKGFKFYSYLDKTINFKKYKISFVGNSPINFKNIKVYNPKDPKKLSNLMLKHQIYITASKNDPCSNSLLEALELKLPSVVLNSGGHTEILKNRGVYFQNQKNLIPKILIVFKRYTSFLKNFNKKEEDILKKYIDYFKFVLKKSNENELNTKKINLHILIRAIILQLSIKLKLKNIL